MHTVTCISSTGEILWVLGGKRNTFRDISSDGSATGFTWQHDARWHSDNVLTLLDNAAYENGYTCDHSRGLMIRLDFADWTADTLHVYDSPGRFSSHSQGSLQVLPRSGNVFVGWGKSSAYTEFSTDGDLLCDFHWGPRVFFWLGWTKSYRAQKSHWIGRPRNPPDVEVDETAHTAYVSWNGATDVAGWVLQRASNGSAPEEEFESVQYEPKEGFETTVELVGDGYFRLVAVDFEGHHMGATRVFEAFETWVCYVICCFPLSFPWPGMLTTRITEHRRNHPLVTLHLLRGGLPMDSGGNLCHGSLVDSRVDGAKTNTGDVPLILWGSKVLLGRHEV